MTDPFDARVQRGEPDECWPWTGKTTRGYGRWRGRQATHVALERAGLYAEPGQEALHSCDNPPCVNVRHLRWGSRSQNVQDAEQRGRARHPRGEQHGRARLTDEQVAEVHALRSQGWTQVALAQRFEITQSYVSKILSARRRVQV